MQGKRAKTRSKEGRILTRRVFVSRPLQAVDADPEIAVLWRDFSSRAGPADVAGAAGIFVQTPEVSELEIAFLFDGSSHKAMTSS